MTEKNGPMPMPARPDWISEEDWDAVDSPPLSDEQLARMRPVAEVAPELIELARRGSAEVEVQLRLSADVLARLQATGPGWEARINDVLRKALETAELLTPK